MRPGRAALLCLVLPFPAQAAAFTGAAYDPVEDELVVGIVYQGTRPDHRFQLQWDPCFGSAPPYGVGARVIDRQGRDPARREFSVQARFGLDALRCRPAEVTLRLGRVAHTTVFVPAEPKRP